MHNKNKGTYYSRILCDHLKNDKVEVYLLLWKENQKYGRTENQVTKEIIQCNPFVGKHICTCTRYVYMYKNMLITYTTAKSQEG